MSKIEHPLDKLFNIEPDNDDEMDIANTYGMVDGSELAQPVSEVTKDAEDAQVDANIDAVYAAAMAAFDMQNSYTEIIEPRYAARNAEVAANYLAIALNAANARGKMKNDRARTSQFIPHANKTTNNLIVADRNSLLEMMLDSAKKNIENGS